MSVKQVFLSYSTFDKEQTVALRTMLEDSGISCWMGNRDIPGGANYTREITKAIRECQVFVLILSRQAQASKYVFRELDYAVKKQKAVLPYMIEDQELTDEFDFLLCDSNGIHAFEDPQGSEKLLHRIRDLLNEPKKSKTPAKVPKPDFSKPQRRKTGRKFIVCPRCGSHTLTESVSIRDTLIRESGIVTNLTLILYFFVFFYFMICRQWLMPIVLPVLLKISDLFWNAFQTEMPEFLFNMISISLIAITYALGAFLVAFLAEMIRSALENRRYTKGIDFWTYRCCTCNKKFRFSLPIKDQSNYFIKDYQEPEATDTLEMILELLKK